MLQEKGPPPLGYEKEGEGWGPGLKQHVPDQTWRARDRKITLSSAQCGKRDIPSIH